MNFVQSALCTVFCIGFFSICQANDEKKPKDEQCGLLHNLSESEIKFPWVATFQKKNGTEDHLAAVILTPSLLVMNGNHFFKEKGKLLFLNFSAYSASVNLTRMGDTNIENPYTQTVEITHIKLHPNFVLDNLWSPSWPHYENDLALIHLKTPIRFDSQVHGLCVPTAEKVQEILSLSSNASTANETSVLISGWKRYESDHIYHRLSVNTEETCKNWWYNNTETMNANYTDRFCVNISSDYTHTKCINKDTAVVGRVNTNEQYYFLGLVNNFYSDNRSCNSKAIIFVMQPTELNIRVIQDNIRCGTTNFTCDNGQCVSLHGICNDKKDCEDGSDENVTYCDAVLNRHCDENQYQCITDRSCINSSKICDGKIDCPGGDDESNCETVSAGAGLSVSAICGIIIGVILFAVLVGVSVYLCRKLKFAWMETGELTDQEVEEFRNGLKDNILNNKRVNSSNSNENENMSCSTYLPFPSTSNFEIPREKLKIEWQKILGKGRFSIVYKAVYDCGDSCYDVAVKTFKTSGPCGCKSAFMSQLSELKIMSRIGPHDNIVNLVGAYTKEIKKRVLYIVVELCQLGNLHAYLTQNRDRFVDVIDRDGTFNAFKSERLRRNVGTQYENVVQIVHPEKSFTTLDLLLWSFQIASAMDYLASHKVSHGDLAARNILLTDNYNAKISDFGLSTELCKTGAYKKQDKKTPLPLRWMAIESLQNYKFTSESDIWSYGVLTWEIFTLGQLPYPGVSHENIRDELVQKGTRLDEPDFASKEIYAKMMECWNVQPAERPSFSSLKTYFQGLYQCLDYVIIPYL